MFEEICNGLKEAIPSLKEPMHSVPIPVKYELKTEPIFPIRLHLTLEEEGKETRKIYLTIEGEGEQ